MIEINGVAHIVLNVGDWDKCKPFYQALLPFLGLREVFDGQDGMYYVGGRTALGVGPCDPSFKGDRFRQGSVGLHHICFRSRSREDIDSLHSFLYHFYIRVS